MTVIIAIGVVLGIGALFLLRSPPTPPGQPITPEDRALLREQVLTRLRERLVDWSFDAPADRPEELTAIESATERRIQMNLERLAEAWFPYHSKQQKTEADQQIEAFVLGATGQSEGEDTELDAEGMKDVLALRLMAPSKVPAGALSRPAGSLAAVLVLRNIGGNETVNTASLEAMGLTVEDAFGVALENLRRDVEEGLEIEALDDTTPPGVLAIAPKDPLAPAYALVPELGARLRKKLGGRDALFYLDESSLLAAVEGVTPEREAPLVPDGQPPSALAWTAVPK